jgi:hypothetical protein
MSKRGPNRKTLERRANMRRLYKLLAGPDGATVDAVRVLWGFAPHFTDYDVIAAITLLPWWGHNKGKPIVEHRNGQLVVRLRGASGASE